MPYQTSHPPSTDRLINKPNGYTAYSSEQYMKICCKQGTQGAYSESSIPSNSHNRVSDLINSSSEEQSMPNTQQHSSEAYKNAKGKVRLLKRNSGKRHEDAEGLGQLLPDTHDINVTFQRRNIRYREIRKKIFGSADLGTKGSVSEERSADEALVHVEEEVKPVKVADSDVPIDLNKEKQWKGRPPPSDTKNKLKGATRHDERKDDEWSFTVQKWLESIDTANNEVEGSAPGGIATPLEGALDNDPTDSSYLNYEAPSSLRQEKVQRSPEKRDNIYFDDSDFPPIDTG